MSGPSKQEGPGRLNMAVDLGDQSPLRAGVRPPFLSVQGPDGPAKNEQHENRDWRRMDDPKWPLRMADLRPHFLARFPHFPHFAGLPGKIRA